MQMIRHRVNQIADLRTVDPLHGVEIDLRSSVSEPGRLHLSHDAWTRGDDFEAWLTEFKRPGIRGPIILNTKEDGLETRVLELLGARGLENFFFLDSALPTLVKWTHVLGKSFFAVRVSRHEPPESIASFRGRAEWVWVDCFGGDPVSAGWVRELKRDFRVCLVSPELQGQPIERVPEFAELFGLADAVCTKKPEAWAKL